MKRIITLVCLVLTGCTNFDVLVEQACSSGRCGTDNNPIVTPPDPPSLSADRQVLDFGSFTSEAQPKRRLIVSNVDGGLAESLTFNFVGSDADDFAITSSSCSSLAVGQTCPIDVQFVTSMPSLGIRRADLVISASRGAPLIVSMQAEIAAALTAPMELDFGDVAVGTDKVLPLRVTNNLPRPGTIAPTIPAPFFLEMNGCTTVGIGQSCDVQVRYEAGASPGSDLERTMFVDIEQNRATVTLKARSVLQNQLLLEPNPLFADDAGAAVEKGTNRDIVFTVHNLGGQPIKSIEYGFTGTAAWTVLDGGCASLAPNGSCQGVLRFSPTSLIFHPARLWADAGVIGSDETAGIGRGVGLAQLRVVVGQPDSGLWVEQSLDGGRCTNQCTWSAWTDPSGPTKVRLRADEHILYNAPRFTPTTSSCDAVRCEVALDRELTTLNVDHVALPLGFLSRGYAGGFVGGIAGADSVCMNEAADAGLPGQFRAVLWQSDGGSGFSRFDAGAYFSPQGTMLVERRDGGLVILNPTQNVWSGSGYSFAYTCSDWTNPTGPYGSYINTNGTMGVYNCASGLALLCLAEGQRQTTPYPGAAVIFAASTTGLGANYQAECEAAGALFGLTYVRPYYATTTRPACRSFSVEEDGGVGDAGFVGSLYRVDGVRALFSARALENCNSTPTPPLLAPVAWAVNDGGMVVRADNRPVRTVGEGSTLYQNSGGTNCANWTSNSTTAGNNHRNYGDATALTTAWWSTGNYTNCGAPNYVYCVGHR